jgi:dihydrofolate reductase
VEGGTTFHFVSDGIESALEQAKQAAGDRTCRLAAGPTIVQHYLAAGLLDEMLISVVPVLLGSGARLFEGQNSDPPELGQIDAVEAPGVTHIRYRVGA